MRRISKCFHIFLYVWENMPWSGLFLNSEVIENFLPFGVMEIWRNGVMEVC